MAFSHEPFENVVANKARRASKKNMHVEILEDLGFPIAVLPAGNFLPLGHEKSPLAMHPDLLAFRTIGREYRNVIKLSVLNICL